MGIEYMGKNKAYRFLEFSVSRAHQPSSFLDKCLKMQNDPMDQMWVFLLHAESWKFCSKRLNVLFYIQLMAIEIKSITPVVFIQTKTSPSRFLDSIEHIEMGSWVFCLLNCWLNWKAKPKPSLWSELTLEFFKGAIAGIMGNRGCCQHQG